MDALSYSRPQTVSRACELLASKSHDTAVLAGGQDLVGQLRRGERSPTLVVDVNHIPDGAYITATEGEVRIGFLTRHTTVVTDDQIRKHCPVFTEATASIGDKQVRNRGTLCGSIASGNPNYDPPVAAVTADATLVLQGATERRLVDARSFFTGPHETVMTEDELLTEIRVPRAESAGMAYERYTPTGGAGPIATVGVVLEVEDDRVTDATIAVGSVTETPRLLEPPATELRNKAPTEATISAAADCVTECIDPEPGPDGSEAYKRELTKTLTRRALLRARDRTGEASQ